ncbi:MAG: DNA/RNA-binding protein albA [Candidatus Bathyarchaeota archaeon BA2]|nr:MAG: DNA/RNA-binding protein albA [Candidatus Bathyarchaeota archaeon BA2]
MPKNPSNIAQILPFFEYLPQIITATATAIIIGILYYCRDRIRKWMFAQRIKPLLKQVLSTYEEKVLPEYVEAKPKLKVVLKKEDIPTEHPFGYIFIAAIQEELLWNTLLTVVPISSSIKSIRILFDENLRKSLFDLLSYRLGLELGKEDIAVKFRDRAIALRADDYETMEKLYGGGKLTAIILLEASIRLRKTKGKPSVSDVKEFSTLVRKIAEIDAAVVRVGETPVQAYLEESLEKKTGIILLARGTYISKAVDIANQLREKGFEMFSEKELGFSNPEIGTWQFIEPKKEEVSFMRIWLRRKGRMHNA